MSNGAPLLGPELSTPVRVHEVEDEPGQPSLVTRLNWDKARRERIVREHGSERMDDEFREQHEAELAAKRKRAKQRAKNSKARSKDKKAAPATVTKRPLLPVDEVLARMEKQQRRVREEAKRENVERERQRKMQEAAKRRKAAKRKRRPR
jgi:hypothetical protein